MCCKLVLFWALILNDVLTTTKNCGKISELVLLESTDILKWIGWMRSILFRSSFQLAIIAYKYGFWNFTVAFLHKLVYSTVDVFKEILIQLDKILYFTLNFVINELKPKILSISTLLLIKIFGVGRFALIPPSFLKCPPAGIWRVIPHSRSKGAPFNMFPSLYFSFPNWILSEIGDGTSPGDIWWTSLLPIFCCVLQREIRVFYWNVRSWK